MNIEFLYFEGCPSHEKALERLQMVMAEEKIQAPITILKVETDEQAQTWQFTGSPTIRVNGNDIDPLPEGTPYNLTCRIYRWEEEGKISPVPSSTMIRQAFQREKNR